MKLLKLLSVPFRMVFTNGHELAVEQDKLIDLYRQNVKVKRSRIRDLKINAWVRTAESVCPTNLVIRQFCLIDLFTDKCCYGTRIKNLVLDLTCGSKRSEKMIWAEGYSYWLYTKDVLDVWLVKYAYVNDDAMEVKAMKRAIDEGFAFTAYKRRNKYYPAPFGDLRNVRLDNDGHSLAKRITDVSEEVTVGAVTRLPGKSMWTYKIAAMPVALNNHCPEKCSKVIVRDGKPVDFVFYDGYDKKYKDKKAEWKDIFNVRRILTVPFVW